MKYKLSILVIVLFLSGCDSKESADPSTAQAVEHPRLDTLLKKTDSTVVKVSPPLVNEAEYKQAIKQQANDMNAFLLKRDFRSFARYTHPSLIKTLGGEKNMISAMKKGFKQMEDGGNKLVSIQIDEPGKVLLSGEELQTTLTETLEMNVPRGKLVTRSALIAISKDQGKHWYFIDVAGRNLKKIQSELPGISDELVIPAPEQAKLIETK